MESTVSYILMAVVVILSIIVYRYKKKQIRYYLLSVQNYPEIILSIDIQKHEGKISAILVKLTAIKDITFGDIRIELISKKREFNSYSLKPLLSSESFPFKLKADGKTEFFIPFEEFRTLLMDGEHPFSTFRFVVLAENGQTFKSHEMGFNKRWIIYRPDSGTYN